LIDEISIAVIDFRQAKKWIGILGDVGILEIQT
jgi:hypothetical protein